MTVLELIDNDTGLYLAKRDNKYGVLDSNGNTKVYIEYDQIGIDNTQFSQNNIKNKYLLDNGMIPVRKDKLWGAFDKNGKQVLNFDYDSFGYIATNNKDAINLLLIPDYNVLVVCKNKKYGLVNSNGQIVAQPVLDDAYMTVNSGKKYYYMTYNDNKMDITEYLDQYAPTNNSNTQTNSNTVDSNTVDSNTTNTTNTTEKTENASETETTEQTQTESSSEKEEN